MVAAQTDSEKFIGSWKINVEESIKLMEPSTKSKYDSAKAEVKEHAKKNMEGRVFIFHENGTMEAQWSANGSSKSAIGSWELREGNKLHIKMGELLTEYGFSYPKQNELVLKNSNGRGFISNLYLERSTQ